MRLSRCLTRERAHESQRHESGNVGVSFLTLTALTRGARVQEGDAAAEDKTQNWPPSNVRQHFKVRKSKPDDG